MRGFSWTKLPSKQKDRVRETISRGWSGYDIVGSYRSGFREIDVSQNAAGLVTYINNLFVSRHTPSGLDQGLAIPGNKRPGHLSSDKYLESLRNNGFREIDTSTVKPIAGDITTLQAIIDNDDPIIKDTGVLLGRNSLNFFVVFGQRVVSPYDCREFGWNPNVLEDGYKVGVWRRE